MVKNYKAPKPKYSHWEWFKFLTVRVVLPPLLFWDLSKFSMHKLVGEWTGRLVLMAQNLDLNHLAITDNTVSAYNEGELICEKHKIITHDDAHLDTFEVKHQLQEQIAPKYQKYLIHLVGNNSCYEQIVWDLKEDANALKANVIGFNLRGVGQSTGRAKSKDDLITDGIAQVQRLLDKGVSPQNITLKGHSLGAGISTLVAQHFHQLGQPINIFNSRSFSSITNVVVGHIRLKRNVSGEAIGQKESIPGTILGWLVKPFIKFGLSLVKWEIDAGSAFKSIPEAYREYIVVRSRKEQREHSRDDKVIPHYASIHKELTAERRKKKAAINEGIVRLDSIISQSDPLSTPCLTKAKESLVLAKEKIKNERKMETHAQESNGHNIPLRSLKNRFGKNAGSFFTEFVLRAEQDHGVKNTLDCN